MATIEKTYSNWRATLKEPDDSLFWYHPSLERIMLGFAIYALSSDQLVRKLGKAKSLSLLHIYIPDLITAWIDDDEEKFETMFGMTITLSESFVKVASAAQSAYPSKAKDIRRLATFFANAVSCGGDMKQELADTLLDDLTTDGKKIYSDKIRAFGAELLRLTIIHGIDMPFSMVEGLCGW